MKTRQLGDSDLLISEISLGSWLTYSGGIEKAEAIACIRTALDLGINFLDTANVYGRGAAETLLGEALEGVDRTSYILATKVYGRMSDTDQGLSRAQIFKQLDQSLHRLKTDYVDLYQCHRYDTETPLEETMEALTEVVQQGKVRYIGFSEWPIDKIEAAANMKGVAPFVSSQPQYSLLWPYPQTELFPLCADYGITQIVWSPLAQGVLTGKYRPSAALPADSRASHQTMGEIFPKRWLEPDLLAAVERLVPLAQEAGLSLPQFALAWVLRQANVSSAIIGATRPAQVIENAAAASKRVSHELFSRAEAIVGRFWQG
ncbi:aldo/keto reductase family protein [Methylovirgula sp. HY1]|uniref:aldo/keto reductase family protein n=1 Tax=Methylovirgula sp. HY1 TaxID=2822761 RepID=UPI001C5B8ABA|nr:aldo/keto reductase family protein [Methylovirgula sp. HY1]QXX75611.1 L-glyceraldehyde 3-phosphate reductase [Methylovirgula sp. HY1]